MKKNLFIAAAVVALLWFGYKDNLNVAVTSYAPSFSNDGKVYITKIANSARKNDKVVLIAVEQMHYGQSFEHQHEELFFMSLSDCKGYPPTRFTIRNGEVYPLEWSGTWGYQKDYKLSAR